MHARIAAIEYYVPPNVLTTASLSEAFPNWTVTAIQNKTGINQRHIAAQNEHTSDLAVAAVSKLLSSTTCTLSDIDFIILCTQSPDYLLPSTACIVQHRLGISINAGALDVNLGCSGFVYSLGLAQGLIESGQCRSLLLITADTYSKYLDADDRGTRALFGDAAAVTWVTAEDAASPFIGPFVYGTDGSGAHNLMVPESGTHSRAVSPSSDLKPLRGHLHMNGNAIFQFAMERIPEVVTRLLARVGLSLAQVDLFVFHQANAYILNELRTSLNIPTEKFQITLAEFGNTVSSTIPIALQHAVLEGRLNRGALVMLVGFGVGYSWSATLLRW